jgi:hypothetical protein
MADIVDAVGNNGRRVPLHGVRTAQQRPDLELPPELVGILRLQLPMTPKQSPCNRSWGLYPGALPSRGPKVLARSTNGTGLGVFACRAKEGLSSPDELATLASSAAVSGSTADRSVALLHSQIFATCTVRGSVSFSYVGEAQVCYVLVPPDSART